MRKKHQGTFEFCYRCLEYIDFWSITKPKAIAHIKKLHTQSITSQLQNEARQDPRFVKAKGTNEHHYN